MQKREAAVKANYDLVVAVAHDLRTPLTALSLYLDLLYRGKWKDEAQRQLYWEKSQGKVLQLQRMTDQLFERFFLTKDDPRLPEAP